MSVLIRVPDDESTISAALLAAASQSAGEDVTIEIGTGTYDEALSITSATAGLADLGSLTITAAAGADVTIAPTLGQLLDDTSPSGTAIKTAVLVEGVDNVTISNVTVDGGGHDPASPIYAAISVTDTGGTPTVNTVIDGVTTTGTSAHEIGAGIYAGSANDPGAPTQHVTIVNADVSDFGQVGIFLDGVRATVGGLLGGNTVTGDDGASSQFGLQAFELLSGSLIDGNVVQNIGFGTADPVGSGIAVFGGDDVTISDNIIATGAVIGGAPQQGTGGLVGIIAAGGPSFGELMTNLVVTGNVIQGSGESVIGVGLDVSNVDGATIQSNDVSDIDTAYSILGNADLAGDILFGAPFNGDDSLNNTIADVAVGAGILSPSSPDPSLVIVANGTTIGDSFLGGPGDDTLLGGDGNDSIAGGGGNDYIDGAAGADSIDGGEGNDFILGGVQFDTISGGEGDDSLVGAAGRDSLSGGDGNDTLDGGTADDTLDGGAGDDSMVGGSGNDSYVVDSTGDVVVEDATPGTTDTVGFTIDTYYLDPGENPNLSGEVENAIYLGDPGGVAFLAGNALDNVLDVSGAINGLVFGADGNDTLIGGDGEDILGGGAGDDSMVGGDGNDAYFVDSAGDIVVEEPGEGTGDILYTTFGGTEGSPYVLADEVEILVWQGVGPHYLRGNGLDNVINGANEDPTDSLPSGVDTYSNIDGGAGNDTISGSDFADSLAGGDGDDVIAGQGGDDLILGGEGNDILSGDGGDVTLAGAGNDSIDGGAGDDDIAGNEGDDTLIGGAGNDEIDGGDGDDSIEGGDGEDSLFGGEGIDTLLGGDGNDSIEGGAGDDSIQGGDHNDTILGGEGNDSIEGGAGKDEIEGGSGNDTILGGVQFDTVFGGDGDDSLIGEAGSDSLEGGEGNDTIDGGSGFDTLLGGDGTDAILGGSGGDSILGGAGADSIDGGSDNDTIEGGADNDTILGGEGDDVIDGDEGKDEIDGGAGNDTLFGGVQFDTILGGDGDDSILGEAGRDRLEGGDGNDTLDGGTAPDTLIGGAGDDLLNGGSGNDTMEGGTGNDTYTVDSPDDVVVEDDEAGSIDTVVFSLGAFSIDPTVNANLSGEVENATFSGTGTAVLLGNDLDNVLDVSASTDATVEGGIGNDTITGGAGNDSLYGEDGDDVIDGGSGASSGNTDVMFGGAGNDTITASDAGIDALYGEEGDDSLVGNDEANLLSGGADNDTLLGGGGNDLLDGAEGADSMVGGLGDDEYIVDDEGDVVEELPGEGTDTVITSLSGYTLPDNVEIGSFIGVGVAGEVDLTGTAGDDFLSSSISIMTQFGPISASATGDVEIDGGAGNDIIIGNELNEILRGGDGDDFLSGGGGSDLLFGGSGNDSFDYYAASDSGPTTPDIILDFEGSAASGGDFLTFDGLGALTYIGDNPFTGAGLEISWLSIDADGDTSVDDVVVEVDIDGDSAADMAIFLLDVPSLSASDFEIIS